MRPRSRIIHRYLRREVLLHAGLGLLLFTFVIFMQDLGRALETTVQAGAAALGAVFVLVLPQALVFTLPMAVLVGVLIGLGRLSVDNEIMALRAAGVGARRLVMPLLQVAAAALAVALVLTLWLAPLALRRLDHLSAQWASAEAAEAVQPRVFFEPGNNANLVIYTGGTEPGGHVWRQVLVADMRNPDAPEITMAERGELARRGADRIQLHLSDGAQYQVTAAHPETSIVSAFQTIDLPFVVPPPRTASLSLSALPLGQLWRRAGFGASVGTSDWRAARVEFYRRFALAFACLALALLGIPLGLRGGRGGKSGGFVLTLMLVLVYYLLLILGIGLARQGKLPPFWGVWAANWLFIGGGVWAMTRLDRIPHRPIEGTDPVAWVRAALNRRFEGARPLFPSALRGRLARGPWMPSLIEGYVTREFLGYTGLLLASFLILVLISTLFELTGSILQNHIPLSLVLEYLLYFSPQMLYMMIPVAILVGVLISFGLMSKSNEIIALKASGVSAYRLLVPVLFAAVVLCAFQFALDATWLPAFNQKQDALHAQIKGQPPQTYRNPEHKWVFGQNHDIYYFSFYDPGHQAFANVSVFQLNPRQFQLSRRIFARQAQWDSTLGAWVFTDGWARTLAPPGEAGTQQFQRFQVATFPDLPEHPAYFATDARQGTQMTYTELRHYIQSLRSSGYDVARLSVTLAKKVAYPLITVIMALLAFPFALTVGRRGAVAGLTVAIVVAIAYWSSSSLLEALGNLNQLPAGLAAWTPDALFLGLGVYLLLRVPT
ncbi:MAG TPA: LptF/LptG family permease [Terriglobales bacterium]|jgi:LPS export ABC transporter permease LptF/LPS export ABC transporter permease LptG